jgi:hypothetical protein
LPPEYEFFWNDYHISHFSGARPEVHLDMLQQIYLPEELVNFA